MVDQKHLLVLQGGKLELFPHQLLFHQVAKTSRDALTTHDIYYLVLKNEQGMIQGVSECSPIFGLSEESKGEVEIDLQRLLCATSFEEIKDLQDVAVSSVRFAIELLIESMNAKNPFAPFCLDANPIPINGLVWMNDIEKMLNEAISKWKLGFTCIKFKVGALGFQDEWEMIREFRQRVGPNVQIRLDANGAWEEHEALEKLNQLAQFNIHSIEQPIPKGNWPSLNRITQQSAIPIALDEELIGCPTERMEDLIKEIAPQYLVLKPSLHGGFAQCDLWIQKAESLGVGWWATSALESNVGLNAIFRWLQKYTIHLPQGLGVGSLYRNNWDSPLVIKNSFILSEPSKNWTAPWSING